MKVEEMFVLMDGTQADPDDCERGKDGVWRHKNGVKVAIDGNGRPERVGDRTVMNSLAAGHRDPGQKPQPRSDRPSDAAPQADGAKPVDPEPIVPIEGTAVDGQQSPGSEKPQE
ncbi:hypothetical protein EOW77_0003505 [Bradyrhizobium yuanmingense]|uniref:hypothetical protein n=1 Tax=Bradyrhizobium yuanmingense TaxID=108015 RepID=UPI000FE3CACB|nr:hypothetical protein [Bradyrhizobium yuanmingense]TGN90912.1 hypothetical protein EOW77_0003505 [Bradyrhizobium yuanmingense]